MPHRCQCRTCGRYFDGLPGLFAPIEPLAPKSCFFCGQDHGDAACPRLQAISGAVDGSPSTTTEGES